MKRSVAKVFLLSSLALASSLSQAEEIVLKVAHFWPSTALAQKKILEPWCDTIKQQSQGRLVCQIYPAMQLGGTPPQLIQQAMDGIADIVWTLPGYTPGRFPSVEAFELPFMTKQAEGASHALWDYYQQYGKEDFKGVKPLAFNVHDAGYVHNNKHPIKMLADFRGLKMRAPTRMTNKMLAYFGATPVAMPLPALPDALSKGVVDGYVLPWEVIPTMKLNELTRYHSETDPSQPALYSAVFTIAMNQAKYDSLPADLQKIIDDNSGAGLSAAIGKAWDESAVSARQQSVTGSEVYEIPASELSTWRKVGDKVIQGWEKDMDGKGYDGKAMVESARALIAKYSQ